MIAALPDGLGRTVRSASRLVVLTGAGMSTECGIPVFRGPGGLWEGFRPEDLATPEAFARDPEKVWRWYRWRLERISEAEPHAGHRALVALESAGCFADLAVITQNVDGMHQRAGNRAVIELHGNLTRARCTRDCGRVVPSESVDPARPACPCGGRLRPDVVWFGESLDPDALIQAGNRLDKADMVWVVGTSSLVHPAAALPAMAARRGVPVVEINPEETPLSGSVPHSLRMSASGGLVALAAEVASG